MMDALVATQRWIYQTLGEYLGTYATSRDAIVLLGFMPLAMVFGAIHALTPGHSKTLLASYLVASPLAFAKALGVTIVLAATHVGSAVVIALFAAELMSRTFTDAGRVPTLEMVSRGALVLIGIWFVLRALTGRTGHAKAEGFAVGFVAGLVPCPLTLFMMVFALSRGVPQAGLAFSAAMMLGIAVTLSAVALLAVAGRSAVTAALTRFGTSLSVVSRVLDGLSGALLISFGLYDLIGY